jgi:subtilase family serine protease
LYFSNIHQTNNVPIDNIVVDGGSAATWTDANDEGEVCLDIEQAVSVAPGLTQLLVYIGPTSFGTGVDGFIFSRMATDNLAKQLSNSWWWSPDDPAVDDPYFEEMAVQGQTLFNISGDFGAYTGNDLNDMGYPAEDIYLTVVGGTELTTSSAGGPWQSEVAWNDFGEGSGGGPADDGTAYFAIQSWQTPVINSTNGGSTTLRNSPDVALQADFDNYICYDSGICATNWGGTSFAAPRWAGFLALANQQVVANGHRAGLGFINPTLYSIGQSSNYDSDFHDITSGNNDTNGQTQWYKAVVGYDLVTGWGSPNGQSLINTLASVTGNTSVTLVPPSLFFGTQLMATSSTQGTVTLTNNSGSPLTISSIAMAGANSSDFGVNHNCPTSPNTLAAGNSCMLQATFTPQAAGPRKSSVNISDNAGNDVQTILLTGVGTAISTAPSSLTFSSQQVGTPSGSLPIVISNEGGTGVNLWEITFVGANARDFSQSNTSTCGNRLGAGANCTVNVIFTAAAAGSRTASLLISDDGGGSPQAVTLAGSGTGSAQTHTSGHRATQGFHQYQQ